MQKRISALLLAMVIVIGSVLGGNTLKVKAASATVAMSPELAAEFYMVLLQVAETAMHVSGANNGFNNKEAMEAIGDGVQGYFVTSMSEGVDFEFQTTDGETFKSYRNSGYPGGLVEYTTADGQTYKLSGDKFTTLLLNGTITLDPDIYNDTDDKPTVDKNDEYVKNMKAMFDAKWEELKEIGFDDGSGGDPTPSPSPDPKKVFTKIALVSLGTSLIAVAGAFVKDLFDGKVEGLNLGTYLGYEDYSFLGSVPVDVNGNFMYRGKVGPVDSLRPLYGFVKANYPYRLCAYINRVSNSSAVVVGRLTSSGYIENLQVWYEGYSIDKASAESGRIGYSYMYFGNETYSFNFPFFESTEDAINYLKTGSLTGLLNGEAYDFPDLVKSVPEVLQPLTGTKFSPSLLPGINTAVSNAVKSLPETSTDTKANTETYKETMTSTITDVAPKTEVVPQPSTTPGTETGEGTEGEAYKRDLQLIFPFCIPFDFIHFIKALSADPVAPCFKIPIKLDSLGIDMVLELDLAWMDPVMEIFRLGELGCFVIMLMAATKKMIGW
mgnify:FL=1